MVTLDYIMNSASTVLRIALIHVHLFSSTWRTCFTYGAVLVYCTGIQVIFIYYAIITKCVY